MTRSPNTRPRFRSRFPKLAQGSATALLCLALGTQLGCGKITDESQVFSAISRMLVKQGVPRESDAERVPGSNQNSTSETAARGAASGTGHGARSKPPASGYVIIKAEETSTLYESDEVPDSKAVFSYDDERGGAHMVRGLHNVPAAYQSRARRLGGSSSPRLNRYDALAVVRNFVPKDVDPASYFNPNRLDVTLFSATWCGACRKTKQLLDSEGIAYNLRDIDDDPDARDEVRRVMGSVTIPLMDVNGTYVSGYDKTTILRLVKGG